MYTNQREIHVCKDYLLDKPILGSNMQYYATWQR